jgi:palmitoyl-protein thioesterase
MISNVIKNILIFGICNLYNTYAFKYTNTSNIKHNPIVILHGLESSSEKMIPLCNWIDDTFSRKVINIEIGNGEKTSLYTPLPEQLSELCNTIYKNKELEKGFDFIGISQGGLLARGYVEQCNDYPVHNLITLVSPHGGAFTKDSVNNNFMYSDFSQKHISFAGYWRNPTLLNMYLDKSVYLPYINNEKDHEQRDKYKNNIINLSNFVMIWSSNDEVVYPAESGKFSFLDKDMNIIPIEETELYKEDTLGLKYLNDNERLHIYETNCSHVDHRNPECFNQLYGILKYYI